MKYSSEIIALADTELQKRRDNAIALQSAHVDSIKDIPEIYSLYSDITSTKSKLAEIVFSKTDNVKDKIESVKKHNLSCRRMLRDALVKNGFTEDYLDVHYTCSKCRDTGYVEGNRCDCLNSLLDKYTVDKLNLQCKIKLRDFSEFEISYYPESYKTKNGSDIDVRAMMKKHLSFCVEYSNTFCSDSPSVFMLGSTGLGKTFLSSCIAKQVLLNGFSVAFDSIQNYLRDIEKEHFGRADGDTLETLLNADLLILDDLGSEFSSSFNSSVIYNIINSRTNQGKPTIVSSNLSFDELTKRYDDRIISRLTGMLKPLRFIGNDIRQIKRQNGIYN